jgi:hypothetical protein
MRHELQWDTRSCSPVVAGLSSTLRLLWNMVRLPLLAVLTLLEGAAQTVLGGLAFLSLLTALFFEYATPATRFPFWETVAFSGACVLTLVLYYATIRALSR